MSLSLPGLPIIVAPMYETKLLSVPKPVTFRPYLVKEEKLLLMAQASSDPKDMETAVRQIIINCTNGTVDPNTLASFDLEYLYLQLRARSVNNVVEVRFECKNAVEKNAQHLDGICHNLVTATINLDEVKVTVPEGHSNKIMLADTVGVTMKYPVATDYEKITAPGADVFDAMATCLETVFTSDGEVYEVSQQTPAEVRTFVESLTMPQVNRIKAFFDTLPRLSHTFAFTCDKCGYTEDITLRGLADFFE